jgi:hypothetical protein
MAVAAYVPNLMDRSRVAAAAEGLGVEIKFASTVADLDPSAPLTILDLSRPGVIEALAGSAGVAATGRSVGFASHVDRELMARGREAGCDQVLARSAFFARLPTILLSAGSDEGSPPRD